MVYLGDYIDRGMQSREVIDELLEAPLEGFETVHLLGNHEQTLLDFLRLPEAGRRLAGLGRARDAGQLRGAAAAVIPPVRIGERSWDDLCGTDFGAPPRVLSADAVDCTWRAITCSCMPAFGRA